MKEKDELGDKSEAKNKYVSNVLSKEPLFTDQRFLICAVIVMIKTISLTTVEGVVKPNSHQTFLIKF